MSKNILLAVNALSSAVRLYKRGHIGHQEITQPKQAIILVPSKFRCLKYFDSSRLKEDLHLPIASRPVDVSQTPPNEIRGNQN